MSPVTNQPGQPTGPIGNRPAFLAPPPPPPVAAPSLLGDELRLLLPTPAAPPVNAPPANAPLGNIPLANTPPANSPPANMPPASNNAIPVPSPSVDVDRLRGVLRGPDAVNAVMAIYDLEELAKTNRDQVIHVLCETLQAPNPDARTIAAIDVLERLKATEALPVLRALKFHADAALRTAASGALLTLGKQPTAQVADQPGTPAPPGYQPTQNVVVPAQPQPPRPNGPAPLTAELGQLVGRLQSYNNCSGAIVQLAQLPADQMIAVASRLINTQTLNTNLDMITGVLAQKGNEPGVQVLLRKIIMMDGTGQFCAAQSRAVIALTASKRPENLPAILTFLTRTGGMIATTKKAVVEALAKNPEAMKQLATIKVMQAMMKEEYDSDLRYCASHALGQSRTPDARAALGASPLLKSDYTRDLMRVMWDLELHPAPYSEETYTRLKALIVEKSIYPPQVKEQAKKLLAKKP